MNSNHTRQSQVCTVLALVGCGLPLLTANAQPSLSKSPPGSSRGRQGTSPQSSASRGKNQVLGTRRLTAQGGGASGGLVMWGGNGSGQLGDSTGADRSTPGLVPGLPRITGVSLSGDYGQSCTLAVKPDGTVLGWGAESVLLEGSGGFGIRPPAPISGLSRVATVALGNAHALALKTDGTVWAWGSANRGQLGDGNATSGHLTPAQVHDPQDGTGYLTGVKAVAASPQHNLALKVDGTVMAWGWNAFGALGDGTTTDAAAAVPVVGLSSVTAVGVGEASSYALKADGTVWGWGSGHPSSGNTPSPISGVTGITAISVGKDHTLALKYDGTVLGWGQSFSGELGANGSPLGSVVTIDGISGVKAIAAGSGFSAALKTDGTVWTWGSNTHGALGDSTSGQRTTPVPVPGLTGVHAIAGRGFTVAALRTASAALAWGSNENGRLGDGTTTDRYTPAPVPGVTGVTALASGPGHSLALRSDGTLVGWGRNTGGQLADGVAPSGTLVPLPITVGGVTLLSGVTSISASYANSLALRSDSTVWTWGDNGSGQRGNGTVGFRGPVPGPVMTGPDALLVGATGVAIGGGHSLVLMADGTVRAWGQNFYGALGDGTNESWPYVTPVPSLTEVTALAAGMFHSVALKSDGTVWAWGYNTHGELGDGTTTHRNVPVQVLNLSGITAVACGLYSNLALKSDGTVWCWGQNTSGQLGDGTTIDRSTPVQVAGLSDIVTIAGGGTHHLALGGDGTVWSWGGNASGQLGDGTTAPHLTPAVVPALAGATTLSAGEAHSLAIGVTVPTISALENQVGVRNTPTGPLSFTVGDGVLDPAGLTVTTLVDDYPFFIAPPTLALGGSGANRTLTITPAADTDFEGRITLTVSNGVNSASTNFRVKFLPEAFPVAAPQSLITAESVTLEITPKSAPDGFGAPFVITSLPQHGHLEVDGFPSRETIPTAPYALSRFGGQRVYYVPDSGFTGSDSFDYRVYYYHGGGAEAPMYASGPAATASIRVGLIAPTLSGISATPLSPTRVRVDWTTDYPSTSEVDYSTPGTSYNLYASAGGLTTAHSVVLDDLTPETLYHFRVRSRVDSGFVFPPPPGLEAVSDDQTFTTPAPPAPAITISAPANQVGVVNVPIGPLAFTVNGPEGLSVTAGVDDYPFYVTPATVSLDGSGAHRTVTVTPAADSEFAGRITLTATDGVTSVSTSFRVKFLPQAFPVAAPQTVITPQDTTLEITPKDTPTNGGPFQITRLPLHGHLEVIDSAPGSATYIPITSVPYVLPQFGLQRVSYVPDPGFIGWDSFDYQVVYHDGAGPTAVAYASGLPAAASIRVGLIAPALSGITATPLSSTRVRVDWTTDLPSTSEVDYSTPGTSYDLHEYGAGFTTAHSMVINGLTPATLYHFRVRSRSDSGPVFPPPPGLEAVSGDGTFTTLAAPTATPQSVSTLQNTPVDLTVAGTSPDPRPLTFALVDAPQHGTLTGPGTADGIARYTPATGYSGADSFTFRVLDGDGTPSAPATVSITVTPTVPNRAPVATGQALSVASNIAQSPTSLTVTLAATDADGNPLTYTLTNTPAHGTLGPLTGDTVTYTPSVNYIGTDLIRFRASDGTILSNQATVSITVTNRAPVAAADNYAVRANAELYVGSPGLRANDTDPELRLLQVQLLEEPLFGELTLLANGSFYYLPAPDFVGTDTFTYRAYDPNGGFSEPTEVTLTITAAPVAISRAVSVLSNTMTTPTALALTFEATDLDGGARTYTVVGGPAHGTLGPVVDGMATYTPTVNYTGTDRITFRVSDGTYTSNTATLMITVLNRAPIATADSYSVRRNGTLRVAPSQGVLANDVDLESQTKRANLINGVAHGSLTLQENGRFVYTPTPGYVGIDTFTYTAYDPKGGISAVTMVTITVTAP